jgi:hypothetical protein
MTDAPERVRIYSKSPALEFEARHDAARAHARATTSVTNDRADALRV